MDIELPTQKEGAASVVSDNILSTLTNVHELLVMVRGSLYNEHNNALLFPLWPDTPERYKQLVKLVKRVKGVDKVWAFRFKGVADEAKGISQSDAELLTQALSEHRKVTRQKPLYVPEPPQLERAISPAKWLDELLEADDAEEEPKVSAEELDVWVLKVITKPVEVVANQQQ